VNNNEEILQTKADYLPLESSFRCFIRKRDQLGAFFLREFTVKNKLISYKKKIEAGKISLFSLKNG